KFFLYTLVGSVVMLLGILALYFYNHGVTGVYTFDVTQYHKLNLPFNLQWWVFLAFFLGFAIKVPMFPFHTWLPDAHTDAPTAGSVILAAVLLKMGTYGFIRFSLPILPEASKAFVPMVVGLSIVGIVYGALVALAQRDWKRLVAYSSVSHMAMVMLGMFALNPVGITGSIVQQLNHGISTGALFLIVGIVYERRHTREISEYGGLSKVMPVYAAIFLIMTMSSIGLPALNGFIGEFLILQGVFVASKMWAAFAASGVVLGAAYMLYLYQRTMFGKVENPKNERLMDLSHREFATFVPLLMLTAGALVVLIADVLLSKANRGGLGWVTLIVIGATLASLTPFTSTHVEVAHGLLAVDRFALFFKIVFLVAAAITVLISMGYVEVEGAAPGEYYFLILCATLGMMIMASGSDLITIFVGLD